MAPPSKCMLIALLVAFAVVAPSAAARDAGAAKDAATAAPAPSASGEADVHPMGLIDDIIGGIIHLPDLPLPRILPCPPNFPKIPLIPCYNVTPSPPAPEVTECRPSLAKFTPACGGFLANGSSGMMSPPSRNCCNAIPTFFEASSPYCYCHVLNGDADELLPAPVNHARALNFLKECGYDIPPADVTDICEQAKAADTIPPMDAAPSPPPPGRQGTKA